MKDKKKKWTPKQGYWAMPGWKGKLFRFFAYKGIYQTNWLLKKMYGNKYMTDDELWKKIRK